MTTARDDLTEHFASVMYENDNSPADWHHAKPNDRNEYLRIAAAKVDAYRVEVLRDGSTSPQSDGGTEARPATSRTKWAAATHLQQAADQTREPDPNLDPEQEFYTAPLGNWLDKVANDMACWAPFREHEGGYRPWHTAVRAAHGVLGLPDPDGCTVCHPRRRTGRTDR